MLVGRSLFCDHKADFGECLLMAEPGPTHKSAVDPAADAQSTQADDTNAAVADGRRLQADSR